MMSSKSSKSSPLFPIFVRTGRSPRRYKSGYIDEAGEVAIPPLFDHGYPFREGYASVRKSDLWGAIDLSGNIVIEPLSEYPIVFTEGLAEFSANGFRGVVDTAGRVIVPARYQSVSHFSDRIACFKSAGLYGYIDSFGMDVLRPQYEDARGFSEQLAAVKIDGLWGYITQSGSYAIPPQFDCGRAMAGPFREGLARVRFAGRWGHINKLGEFVNPARFDMAYEFQENRAVVILDKRAGYVDGEGKVAIAAEYRQADSFSEGLAAVGAANSREIGFINRRGESVIPPRFTKTGAFKHGRCLVETEKEVAYIDMNGEAVWSSAWVEVAGFDPLHLYPPEFE